MKSSTIFFFTLLIIFNLNAKENENKIEQSEYGKLTFLEYHKDGINGVEGLNGPWFITVSSDNKNIYVTCSYNNAVAVFQRDLTSGTLTYQDHYVDGENGIEGLGGAFSVVLSHDNKNVYIAGKDDNAVAVFQRDLTTGALTFLEYHVDSVNGVDGLGGALSVTVSPDNKNVYVAAYDNAAVAVFQRDLTSGTLTFIEYHKDGYNGVQGLNGAWSVTVSPDNKNIYVTGQTASAVAVFQRDLTTGALTFLEYHTDGVSGVEGLDGASSVTVSSDNKNVYIAGAWDLAISVFQRDLTTGTLTFLEHHKNGINGVKGLTLCYSATVSPDNKNVYVAGAAADAVAVFERDPATGTLAFLEYHKDGVNGVEGLNGPYSVTVSSDNKNVYLASRNDDAVAVFERDLTTGIDEEKKSGITEKFQLYQNYPNPFNPKTVISYQLPVISEVELSIYNTLGQRVVTLVSKKQSAGHYTVEWDATGISSGVYFYRIETRNGFIQTKKLIFLK